MANAGPPVEVADGVLRCGTDHVNWYLVEGASDAYVVDAGFPTHWEELEGVLAARGRGPDDLAACLLTHAHPDHVGFAQRLAEEADVRVWLHEAGDARARDGGDPPLGGFLRNLWHPEIARYVIEIVRSDGTSVDPVTDHDTFDDGTGFDLPGSPEAIHLPGHTEGQVAYYLRDRDVLLCGDALATVDFETWNGHGPRLLPPWLNEDHDQARRSVETLETVGDVVLAPGHGDPWTGNLESAIRSLPKD